jgi:hypothetical protein
MPNLPTRFFDPENALLTSRYPEQISNAETASFTDSFLARTFVFGVAVELQECLLLKQKPPRNDESS